MAEMTTFRVEMVFTLPTPPGETAIKHKVVIGDGLTEEEAALRAVVANRVLFGLQGAYAKQKPPKGWAPMSMGVNVVPA